jgi:hypothetical protein
MFKKYFVIEKRVKKTRYLSGLGACVDLFTAMKT